MGYMKKYSVFVVENDPQQRALFQQALGHWQHLVCYCSSLDAFRQLIVGVIPDVVVCNINIPGLREQDFLRFVQNACPHSIRIVFSEKESCDFLLKTVASGAAHRAFSLPLDAEGLSDLEHDLTVRSRIRVRKCWDFMRHGQGLPSLPSVMRDLERVLRNPNYSLNEVVEVIEHDPVLAARMLQIVNSAVFTRTVKVDNLHRAVNFLGIPRTRKMILFLSAINHFQYPKKYHRHALRVIDHSIQCGRLAGFIAEYLVPGEEQTAVTAGLLHDIGKLVFLSSLEEELRNSTSFMERYKLFATEMEEQIFGVSHLELGSSLLLWWNLPFVMVDSAANHSQPINSLQGIPLCVAIADRCLLAAAYGRSVTTDLNDLPQEFPVEKWLHYARILTKDKHISIAA